MMATATERLGISILRIRLGAALQRHRLNRGLTQAELAEFADLSLKYVGEIERGEANTTIEVLERLSAVVGWDAMEALEGLREPLSEGVRLLLLEEVNQIAERLRHMTRWLQALDPALQTKPLRTETVTPDEEKNRLKVGRPSRNRLRRQLQAQAEAQAQAQAQTQAQAQIQPDPQPQTDVQGEGQGAESDLDESDQVEDGEGGEDDEDGESEDEG
jgi:transcriptional regulator with XRE-family HTH domain